METIETIQFVIELIGSVFKIVQMAIHLVFVGIVTLFRPGSDKEWRQAWMWVVFPVFFVGGFGILVSWLIHYIFALLGFTLLGWILILIWLFYFWVGEPFMYITYPEYEINREEKSHWIDTGE